MGNPKRMQSELDIYHIVTRGCGKQTIYIDEQDHVVFLNLMKKSGIKYSCNFLTWCLMDNHAHLLIRCELENISPFMRDISRDYARYFNDKYEREGHLFQGRFKSEPINSNEHLIAAVRYIHLNPIKAGLAKDCRYRWSSFESIRSRSGFCDHQFVLDCLGGIDSYLSIHNMDKSDHQFLDVESFSRSSTQRANAAYDFFSPEELLSLKSAPKERKKYVLRILKEANISLRQIERLTGISKTLVAKLTE